MNDVFNFMEQNNLVYNDQLEFRPNDSCINQLASIAHCTFCDFEVNALLEVRVFFLAKYLIKYFLLKYLIKSDITVFFTNL